ncbi:YlbF family regulator [Sporosalibacterium faouarense]|uniref:YlbF family regulator n=1 Tax=Sporosalibacterium faouarense TaxID=516123 RepID=UPI00141D7330|nr:YlbF family regulator [Sporosalibacterium faouarense]MTI48962.1 YlbF family regulator [Bacillota bacterium]
MNVYDAAHNLARALKNSNEYRDFTEKRKRVMSNPKSKEMLEDFRKKAMEVQMAQMQGQKIEQSKNDELKRLEKVLVENPAVNEFFNSEMRFSQVMNDIYKILGEAIDTETEK